MEKNNEMLVVYNMGNFHNGKAVQTHDKAAMLSYEKAGYKLISCVMMSVMQYLKGEKK